MLVETQPVDYQTVVVGAAPLLMGLLTRLGVAEAIDRALHFQPEIATTYGALAQVIIVNRMTFQPCPLYGIAEWAARHGIDRLFDLQATWLDDDRLGALLDGLAKHQVTIWTTLLTSAMTRCQLDLEWLHADTTSIYFEGAYEQGDPPKDGEQRIPRLVEGYNKDGQRHKAQFVLSLITTGRIPLWFRPWDGNQSDDAVYLADMTELRKTLLTPANAVPATANCATWQPCWPSAVSASSSWLPIPGLSRLSRPGARPGASCRRARGPGRRWSTSAKTTRAKRTRTARTIASAKSSMRCLTPRRARCIRCAGSSVGPATRPRRTPSSAPRRWRRASKHSRASGACWANTTIGRGRASKRAWSRRCAKPKRRGIWTPP